MTLTIKDSLELTSQGKHGSPSQSSENKPGLSPRSNPVCLEVPVTVRSLPGDDSSGSSGPIREEGRTVIVFDNGAVLRLSNNLPPGQKVILSNAQGSDVVCRIVKGQNLPTVKGYIEVEFIEQFNDFWRIHQTGEPVSVSLPAAPALPPQPVSVTSPAAPQAAPFVPPRVITPEKETTNASGSGPTFDDIAGLVRMSPPAASRVKANESASQVGSLKSKVEAARPQVDSSIPHPSDDMPVAIADIVPVKRTVPAPQEFSSLPMQNSARSSDVVARGMLASGQMSSSSSSNEARSRTPLLLGGAALVLAGLGAGYYFMHQGSTPAPAAPVAAVQPSASVPSAQSIEAEPVPAPQPAVEQAPAESQPDSTIASAAPEPVVSASTEGQNSRRPANNNSGAKQPDRASKQRQQIPSLKMRSPSAPRQDLGKLSAGSAPSVTDVSSAVAVGGAPPASMLAPVVRTENQPAPPPSINSPAPSARSVREPKLISSTQPTYPAVARQSNTQGMVVVSAEVDARGIVTSAKAISGPVTLRQAAIDAVKQWKYSPALIDGKPASAQVTVNVQFRLN